MNDFMSKKVFLILVAVTLFNTTVFASTVKWLIKPQYDAIGYFSATIFKCKNNGKWQLIDAEGKNLLPYTVDSITDCIEGNALALDKEGENYRIKGFIEESSHRFIPVKGDYYVGAYPYFSDGCLPVANPETNLYGYINKAEQLLVPYKYHKARPFIKGLASVEPKERKTIYIDKEGKRLRIRGFQHDKIVIGSSFNQKGEALIAYYGNDNAIINTNGEVVRKYERKKELLPVRSYDFAFDESGKPYNPQQETTLVYDKSVTTYSVDGLIGYMKGENTLVPAQFRWAGEFANGFSIVSFNDKFGVLYLIEGDFSSVLAGDNNVVNTRKEMPTFVYTLSLPDSIAQLVEVKFDNGDGILRDITLKNNSYTFTPTIENNVQELNVKAQVFLDGLLLWEDETTQNLNNIQLEIAPPFCDSEYADGNGIVHLKTKITNNSELTVKVSAYFIVKFAKDSQNSKDSKASSWAMIPPGADKEFHVDLKVVEVEEVKATVSVIANGKSCGAKSSIIKLKPLDY